jgi:hypothetical protein
MKLTTWVCAASAALVLAACGGGGGDKGDPLYGSGSGSTSGSSSSGTGSNTNVATNSSGSVVLALSNSTISASQPATVTAVVKDASGAAVPNVVVEFSLTGTSSSIANLAPVSVMTDSNGQAATTLSPASGATSGSAYVQADVVTSAGTLTTKSAFSVSATNVTLSSVTLGQSTISGYGSTSVNFTVTNVSSTNPVTLNVTSSCAASGKATISPASLTLTSSTGSVTYQDKACSQTDRISVQVAGTTQQQSVDLAVSAPPTQGIQYASVDRSTICLKGTGCPSVANVTFKVVDSSGTGKSGVVVDFSLDSSVSGFADLGSTFGATGNDGTVSVAVASRTTPTPLRVTATVRGSSPTIQTVSNLLTISGGLPVAGNSDATNGISFAATKYAMLYEVDGDSADLTLRLRDQWGAPAVDGTAVTLVSDGGTVVPQYCTTTSGSCSVKLVVSNPRPANGRVHVVAYAKGQEYFVDLDSNSVYSTGDSYNDVPAGVCNDKNENNSCDAGEFVIGDSSAPNAGNGSWDGSGTAYAREHRLFFFSKASSTPRLYEYDTVNEVCTSNPLTVPMAVTMGSSSRQFVEFCVRDGNTAADALGGNPLPSGSTLAVKATITTVTVAVDNSPIPAVLGGPTRHVVTVTNPSAPTALTAGGNVDLSFTMGGRTLTIMNAISIAP